MIGYFVEAGDPEVSKIFQPYRSSFRNIVQRHIAPNNYGDDLQLILIDYHLEGKFLPFPKQEYRVHSYRRNERSIIVIVGVRRDFGGMSSTENKKFIVDSTFRAVELARDKMRKLSYSKVDFVRLLSDLHVCAQEYFDFDVTG